MNDHEKSIIKDNLYALIDNTSCSDDFLIKFKSCRIFTKSDIKAIRASGEDILPMDQSYQFYRRLLTTTSTAQVFDVLLAALLETDQMISFQILSNPPPTRVSQHSKTVTTSDINYMTTLKPGTKYKYPPKALLEFLGSSAYDILLLECLDTQLTLARCLDTISNVEILNPDAPPPPPLIKPNTLFLCLLDNHGQTREELPRFLKTPSWPNSTKLVILHTSLENIPNFEDIHKITRGKERLEWMDLTDSFQFQLCYTLKESLAIPSGTTPDPAVIQLIKADATNGSLLTRMIEDYADEFFRRNNIDEKIGFEDLGRVAIQSLHPELNTGGKPILRNNYVELGMLHVKDKGGTMQYEFSSEIFGHYFLAKYIFAQEISSVRLREAVFRRRKITLTPFRNISDFVYETSEYSNKLTMYFINSYANRQRLSLDEVSNGETLLLASLADGYTNISEILLSKIRISPEILRATILLGELNYICSALEKCCKASRDSYSAYLSDVTLLRMAVIRGKLEIVEKLVHDYNFGSTLNKKEMQNLISFAFRNSLAPNGGEVGERKSIVILLTKLDEQIVYKRMSRLWTPTLTRRV